MSREPFEAMPDVMDAKQLAEALQISKAGAYNLLSSPDFPTLRIGGRKLVMKNELMEWLKSRTNDRTMRNVLRIVWGASIEKSQHFANSRAEKKS